MRRLMPFSRAWWEQNALTTLTLLALLVCGILVVRFVRHFRLAPHDSVSVTQPAPWQRPDRPTSTRIPEDVSPAGPQWRNPMGPFGDPSPPPSGPGDVETPPNYMEDLP